MEIVQDSTGKQYKLVNGTCYHIDTDTRVIYWLDYAMQHRIRVHLHYGDTATGKDWNEENDVEGRIGRSTGQFKIPLMISDERLGGGPGLLEHCILKISDAYNGQVYFQHPFYQESTYTIVPSDLPDYKFNLLVNGELYSRHKSKKGATRLRNFLSK